METTRKVTASRFLEAELNLVSDKDPSKPLHIVSTLKEGRIIDGKVEIREHILSDRQLERQIGGRLNEIK